MLSLRNPRPIFLCPKQPILKHLKKKKIDVHTYIHIYIYLTICKLSTGEMVVIHTSSSYTYVCNHVNYQLGILARNEDKYWYIFATCTISFCYTY